MTPGSVAGNVLVPGDIILKIGNNNVTNVSHNDGQDLIRYSGDLLQLTIKRLVNTRFQSVFNLLIFICPNQLTSKIKLLHFVIYQTPISLFGH